MLRGRYEPVETLGEGGEARVVRALDRLHDRAVALKIRPAPVGAPRDELLREARILLSLEPHPNLPLVREDFFDGDSYVIVMDWVDGVDLERLLREQGAPGLAPSTVLRHLAQVAEALTHLHTHDPVVVHGDVKPANVILSSRGKVVLVDFGLAGSGAARTARKGTPGFVAPEVAAGGEPTRASDVYSLAMSAFALLTGSPPSGGRAAWPEGIDSERARVFERAIGLGTATDPKRRPSSAGEFLELLRAEWEADLPTGVLTFLMTDVEESTALWESHPSEMAVALARHDELLTRLVESGRGRFLKSMGEGDSTVSVFNSASDAVPAAAEIVRALEAEPWPDDMALRVRVGLHTGEAELRDGDLFGPAVNLAARIRGEAEGGQVFLSSVTARLVEGHLPEGFGLVDLGAHGLRGFTSREHIHALTAPHLRPPPTPATCPYRGLLAFEPDDAALFFGREGVLDELVERLSAGTFFALVGASGSGKSSLLRAGLVAAAGRGEITGVSTATVITPTSHASTPAALPDDPAQLLVVDQFEELFTACPQGATRAAFVERLLSRTGKVVISIRADFYGHCATYPDLARLLAANQMLLGPMDAADMQRSIDGPARAVGLRLEAGLAEVIVRDAAGEPGALPLLSHALMETWARRDGRTLTLAGYRDAGGVRGAIAHTAEQVFGSFSDAERRSMERVFVRLTELGEGTDDTRRRVRLAELVTGDDDGETRALLERLTLARLITVDEGVQVAHEALIREWPRLREWLNADRESLRLHRHVTQAAAAWEKMGRDPGELYRGARLHAAEELSDEDLTPGERGFLAASVAEQDRELRAARAQARRLRRRFIGVAVALVIAILAGSLALVSRSSAQRASVLAQSGRVAALSRESAPTHPDVGLLLALEAQRLRDSVDTRGALLGALEHGMRIAARLGGFDSPPAAVTFSPDAKTLATVTLEGTRLWDATTYRPLGPPLRSKGSGWQGGGFSPDGKTIAITNQQGNVELWDVATRTELRELASPDHAWLEQVGYSPDGRLIAAAGREISHITLWDARTGRVLGEPITTSVPAAEQGAGSFAFSPDSKVIAAQSEPGRVAFFDVASHRAVGSIAAAPAPLSALTYSSDGRLLAVADDGGGVSIFDVPTRRRMGERLSIGEKPALSVAFGGGLLAAGSADGAVVVWDVASGQRYGPPLVADASPVENIAFTPDGARLATAHNRTVVVWDLSGRQAIGEPLGRTEDVSLDVAFRRDERELVAAGYDGTIRFFDPGTRREVDALKAAAGPILSVGYSPDGSLVAAAGVDGRIRFWNASSKEPAGTIFVGDAWLWRVAFSPDGKHVAVAVDPNGPRDPFNPDREGEVQLWDVASRQRVGKSMVPGKHAVTAVAFSPDGSLLASGSFEERAMLWNVATQQPVGNPMDVKDDGVVDLAFSPDGKRLVTAGAGVVRLWNVATQRLDMAPLTGHTFGVGGTSFDPRGRFLATTGSAGETRIWDPASGAAYGDALSAPKPASATISIEIRTPFLPLRSAFSPDGRFLAVSGIDNRLMLWDMSIGTWKRRACEIAGRNLTHAEWTKYLPAGAPYRRTCEQWPAGPAA